MLRMIESIDSGVLNSVFLCCQIFLIVAVAYTIHRLLSRRPGIQHFVWLIAVLSIGIAVPLQFQIPPVDVELQTTVPGAMTQASSVTDRASKLVEPKAIKSSNQNEAIDAKFVVAASVRPSEVQSISNVSTEQRSLTQQSATPLPAVATLPRKSRWLAFSVYQLLSLIYFAVVAVLGLRLLAGFWMLHSIKRNGFEPDLSQAAIKTTLESMGLKTAPQVLLSDATSTPMAFGIFKPVILMPKDFESLAKPAQQIALMHEASHVVRRDAIWDLTSRIVSIAYWFHPAIHVATRFLRRTRERATDSMVLDHGISSSVYATQLLEIATRTHASNRTHNSNHVSALCMAFDGDVKNRISTILAPRTPAKRSSKLALSMKLLVAALFIALASVSLNLSFAKEPVEVTGSTFFERLELIEPRQRTLGLGKFRLSGRVTDAAGKPVGDAIVVVRESERRFGNSRGLMNDVVAKTRTRPDGTYRLEDVSKRYRFSRLSPCEVFVATKNRAAYQRLLVETNETDGAHVEAVADVVLNSLTSVKGRVVDSEQRPVVGASVSLFALKVDELGTSRFFWDQLISPSCNTDQEGRFELKDLPKSRVAHLRIEHVDFAPKAVSIKTRQASSAWSGNPAGSETICDYDCDYDCDLELQRGALLSGKVLNNAGDPVQNVKIELGYRLRATTSTDGMFQFCASEEEISRSDPMVICLIDSLNSFDFDVSLSELRDGSAVLQHVKQINNTKR